ncbi:MAG: hypothetical protein AAGK04_02750 [Planctomycetota bacterium]
MSDRIAPPPSGTPCRLLMFVVIAAAWWGCSSSSGSASRHAGGPSVPEDAVVRSAEDRRAEVSADPGPDPNARPRRLIRAAEPIVWAMPGVRLVTPVESADGRRLPKRVRVRAADGTTVEGLIRRVDVEFAGTSTPRSLAGGWLPEPGIWSTEPADTNVVGAALSQFVLVVDLPPEARGGPVWVDRNRFDLRWLPPVGDERSPALASPLGAEGRRSRVLAELARAERRSPLRRWRYRLSVGRLAAAPTGPPERATAGVARAGGRFDDPVIEAIARQREAWWRRALADLHAVDSALASELRGRLAATVRLPATPRLSPVGFAEDTIVPVWPTDQADLDALLTDLLDRDLPVGDRRSRTRAWLGAQPVGMGWIVADAATATIDAAGERPVARVILANLSGRSAFGSALATGEDAPPQLEAPPPNEARVLDVPLPDAAERLRGGVGVRLQVGDWRSTRAAALPTTAAPPGWRLAGFHRDWTLDACLRGEIRSLAPAAGRETAALVYRDTDTPFSEDPRDGWWLYVECQRRPRDDEDERVRVWFGPMGLELGAIEVRADGRVGRPDGAKSITAWDASRVRVEQRDSQWTATIPIPPVLIGDDGTLFLGVERIGAGERQAWPRPMLPWQTEPGRAAGDLSRWALPPR